MRTSNASVIVPLNVVIFPFFIGLTPSPRKVTKANLTATVLSMASVVRVSP